MPVTIQYRVPKGTGGTRLDTLLAVQAEVSRSRVAKWIENGLARVNNQEVRKPGHLLREDALVELEVPSPEPLAVDGDPTITFDVLYEDGEILVLNKPAGLVVHPGAGARRATLVHGLVAYLGEEIKRVGNTLRPGIVHRLDKLTSGVLLVAKTEAAHLHLAKQFAARSVEKHYLALVLRLPAAPGGRKKLGPTVTSGVISLPIGRSVRKRTQMAVDRKRGRAAETHWRVKERLATGFLLELDLKTGRTHQIRVHLSAVGAPIVGDPEYGVSLGELPPRLRGPVKEFGRQALHAWSLTCSHPKTLERLTFEAPLPRDFEQLILHFNQGANR